MPRPKKTRREKLEDTRRSLFSAAIEVVGEDGYAAASVTRITARAMVANGTFYNYFENRQDLFDQLLPALGDRLLEHIRGRLDDSVTGLERERIRITAYFDFCRNTPGFLRILNEAEVFAPAAYHRHVRQFYEGYRRSLQRSLAKGEIEGLSEDDLGPVVFMLMGMRSYMTMLHKYEYIEHDTLTVERLIDVYCKLVSEGMFRTPSHETSASSRERSKSSSRISTPKRPTDSRASRSKGRRSASS